MSKKPFNPVEKIKDKARPQKMPKQFTAKVSGKKKSSAAYGKFGSRPY